MDERTCVEAICERLTSARDLALHAERPMLIYVIEVALLSATDILDEEHIGPPRRSAFSRQQPPATQTGKLFHHFLTGKPG